MSDSDEQWVDRYRPDDFESIQGNTKAIDQLKNWASNFPADRTPQLLEGAPGTGKTTTVEVIADWLDLQLTELNASSARRKEDVSEMASRINSRTADGERRVILLDEVDSWHASTDLRPLYDALDNPVNIVFATCNDQWETPDGIVSRCNVESFSLGVRSRKAKLREIAEKEDLDLDAETIERFAERPDLRSAINDLQLYGEHDEVPGDARDWDISEWDVVDNLMTGTAERGQYTGADVLLWMDENLSKDWRGLELAWGHEALSRADVALMSDKRAADAIVDTLSDLRLTEPYYDDGIGRKKEFPEWFRHSEPKASDGSDEARLYRALSNYDSGEPGLMASFTDFRERILPRLRDLDIEDRHELILDHRLSPDEYEALDVTESQHESWVEEESPSKGDGLSRTEDASAW